MASKSLMIFHHPLQYDKEEKSVKISILKSGWRKAKKSKPWVLLRQIDGINDQDCRSIYTLSARDRTRNGLLLLIEIYFSQIGTNLRLWSSFLNHFAECLSPFLNWWHWANYVNAPAHHMNLPEKSTLLPVN